MTAALAASTARRRGTAANVVRIRPLAYSEVIRSTPSAPKASWASPRPLKLSPTGSKAALALALMVAQWVASAWVTRYPTPTAAAAAVGVGYLVTHGRGGGEGQGQAGGADGPE